VPGDEITLSDSSSEALSWKNLRFDVHCCHMGTSIKHRVSARPGWAVVCNFWHSCTALWRSNSDAQPWASECTDVKNYKWRLNPVWQTHDAL